MKTPPEFHDDARFEIFAKGGLVTLSVIAGKTKQDYTMSFRDGAALAIALGKALIEAAANERGEEA